MGFGWSVQSKAGATAQPLWSYPPPFGDEKGFGVEPSNVRSSAAPYAETLLNYLSFQQVVQGATYASWPELPSFGLGDLMCGEVDQVEKRGKLQLFGPKLSRNRGFHSTLYGPCLSLYL